MDVILLYCMGDTVLEGKDAESIRNASERIAKVLEEVDIEHTIATDDYSTIAPLYLCCCLVIFTAFLRFMTPKCYQSHYYHFTYVTI
jgi:hypothetical protein